VVFSGYPRFPTNKTDRHDITEILLKVALNNTNQDKHIVIFSSFIYILAFNTINQTKTIFVFGWNKPYYSVSEDECFITIIPFLLYFLYLKLHVKLKVGDVMHIYSVGKLCIGVYSA
jgi:hypothetical protein